MKKFGKIFGVAAIAVATLTAGAVGLSGCGNNASVSEIQEYVASETTINSMDAGYSFEIEMGGITKVITKGQVSFVEDGKMELALVVSSIDQITPANSTQEEIYLRGNDMYTRENATDKYTKTAVDFSDVSGDVAQMVAQYVQMADLSTYINQFLPAFEEMEGSGLKVSKSGKNGTVKYSMSYKDRDGKMSFVLAYQDDQIVEMSILVDVPGLPQLQKVKISFKLLDGSVEFPADLDTNFELAEEEEEIGELAA